MSYAYYLKSDGGHPWRLRFVCCGHDDGAATYETWEAADAAREAYIHSPEGHERAAILEENPS